MAKNVITLTKISHNISDVKITFHVIREVFQFQIKIIISHVKLIFT